MLQGALEHRFAMSHSSTTRRHKTVQKCVTGGILLGRLQDRQRWPSIAASFVHGVYPICCALLSKEVVGIVSVPNI